MAFVEVKGLRVSYGKTLAVRGLSFEIPEGEVFGFIGPNGAGKTTTIKVLATLLRPDAGAVRIRDINVVRRPHKVRPIIGYMPDFFGVYDDLTVNEYLHFFAAAYRLGPKKRRAVVGDVLELTDLGDKRDTQVEALSRGMKQRLGLARVLLHDPALLLLDEPASGLDPRARIEIRELLRELKKMGKTILISSHILHELSQMCTRIGIVETGRMVAQGSLADIYRQLGLLRAVHVRLANDSDDLLERIARIPGVEDVQRDIDRISLRVRQDQVAVEDVLAEMVAAGARVRMFQPEAMDMETAFMKLTEGKTA
ncbi:MAG: ABC transporter ATP-binding protein [Planctomycetota bacterium]